MIRIKRAYEARAPEDGQRFLVERLWPRGMRKEALAGDTWLKEVAPSTALRKWFNHQVERWDGFQRRYRSELDAAPHAWQPILDAARRGDVTLVYSAHDPVHNGARVLRDYLAEQRAVPPARQRSTRRSAAKKRGKPAGRPDAHGRQR